MKKINKTKKGFTLVEMVLVIAILVILAMVLILNISNFLDRAKGAASSVSLHNWSISSIDAEIQAQL